MAYGEVKQFIAGEWRNVFGEGKPIFNPATEEEIGHLPVASEADIAEAVKAADEGFREWSVVPAADRASVLKTAAEILRGKSDTVAERITLEQGKPLASAGFEPAFAAMELEWYAEEAVRAYGRVIPSREPGQRNFVIKQPVGPSLLISPWNYPMASPNVKIGACLAAGCSFIVKPASETPAGCMELIEALLEAGVPPKAMNMVTGSAGMIAEKILASDKIRKVSFTGSTQVGRKLLSMTALRLQQLTMELGGHAPVIVNDDVDLDAVVPALVAKKLQNGGQVCISPTRFYVHRKLYVDFADAMAEAMSRIITGNGLDPATELGPMINAESVENLEMMTEDAKGKGASVLAGGGRVSGVGHFFQPTVLRDVSDDAEIMNEEPFGPIVPIQAFDDLDSAIEKANTSPYGLNAYAFAASREAVEKLGSGIEAGIVSINRTNAVYPETPMGGIKASGYGKELGTEGMDAYYVSKFISENNPLSSATKIVARG